MRIIDKAIREMKVGTDVPFSMNPENVSQEVVRK